MAKGHRPPPLNLSLDDRPSTLPHVSRTPFLEKGSPLPSPRLGRGSVGRADPVSRTLGIANDFLHIVVCMVLIYIMALFLGYYPRAVSSINGPHSVVLVITLTIDAALDFRSIALYDRPWDCWSFLLRAFLTLAYFGVLVAYLAIRRVFPKDYTYWKLAPRDSSGPALGLLCAILAWNTARLLMSSNRVCWDGIRRFAGGKQAAAAQKDAQLMHGNQGGDGSRNIGASA